MSTSPTPNVAEAFGQRLQQIMREAGLEPKPSVLLHGFNTHYAGQPISWQTARNWLRGLFLPQPDKLQALAQWLQVQPEYLYYGSETPTLLPPGSESAVLSASDQAMWQHYLSSTPPAQQMIKSMVATCAQVRKLDEDNQTQSEQLAQLAQENGALREQLAQQQMINSALAASIPVSTPDEERQAWNEERTQLVRENGELREQLATMTAKNRALRDQLSGLEKTMTEMQKELEFLRLSQMLKDAGVFQSIEDAEDALPPEKPPRV